MDGKQIKDITPEGLSYIDDEGKEQFINFSECYASYVQKSTSPEYWERIKRLNNFTDADWDDHLERVQLWREVGKRDMIGNPAYMEFNTTPPTRFTFATWDEFLETQQTIERAGWQTFDLS